MLAPHLTPPHWPDVRPGRLAARIQRADAANAADARLALVGLPDDNGVALNHGRPGAADGPSAFRDALARFGADHDALTARALDVPIVDVGDVAPARPEDHAGDAVAALHETHDRVTHALAAVHAAGLTPVGVGGGHDLTFPAVRALAQHLPAAAPLGGVNVDPHLDVREAPGSGMPYRALIDAGFLDPKRFVEYGTGRFAASPDHLAYLTERGATIATIDHLRDGHWPVRAALGMALPSSDSVGFVSIDLDVLDAAVAPGVSAMNPSGMDLRTVCAIAERAGAHPGVRHIDIMELSPAHDDRGRTALAAALIFLHILAGFTERPA